MKSYLTKTTVLITLGILAFLCFIWAISGILLPFILAFVLAYILHPFVEKLCTRRLGRGLATGLTEGLFCFLIIAVFLLIVPILQAQLIGFMRKIPLYSTAVWDYVKGILAYAKDGISSEQMLELSDAVRNSAINVLTAIGVGLSNMLTGGIALFNILALILITPVVLFYVLKDWKEIETQMERLIPRRYEKPVKSVWSEIDQTLSGFIRGQALVCVCLAVFYGIGLSLVGLDFGILVGLLAGLLSFIPYFGFGTGLVLSLFLGLMQGFSWGQWGGLTAVFVIGQLLEGYVLTPRLVGNRVGLTPVWVIFALLAGGTLAGFVGILIAVPVAAVIGVLLRRGLALYRESGFYKGRTGK